ncbi:Acyl-CoA N-acyltransferase [Hyaloscypha variabilis]|jgi:GNAT superfamily N-acetyltransferase
MSSTTSKLPLTLRLATVDDIPALTTLINTSVRTLHAPFYTQAEIEGSLASVYGVDTTLVKDGNYFVVTATLSLPRVGHLDPQRSLEVEDIQEETKERIVACGGWSFRSTLYGGDQLSSRNDNDLMNPETDAAKIRALFVHPDYTRMGIGGLVVDRCEEEARKRGFKRAEMGATFAGVDFYRGRGYKALMDQGAEGVEERKLGNGEVLRLVRMGKALVE